MKDLKPGMQLLNVGSNSTTSVRTIAELTVNAMGLKNTKITYSEGNIGWKGDVNKFQFDISKVNSMGWTAKNNSDAAVKLTLEKTVK